MAGAEVVIYTDGSCSGNPGPGGYGAVIIRGGEVAEELSQGYAETTNNRMELMAVIKALEATEQSADAGEVTVYSDSSYVVNAFNRDWIDGWIARGWRKADGDELENQDLWRALVDVARRIGVKFEKVAAHTGDKYNERADALAVAGTNSPDKLADAGFLAKSKSGATATAGSSELTHLDRAGNVQMVDISAKSATARRAVAAAEIRMQAATLDKIYAGELPKGDVLATARIAAVSAAKQVHSVIPLCHQIPLEGVDVQFDKLGEGAGLSVQVSVTANWKTGVEMEALYAASVATLTIYDMCKAVDKTMKVTNLHLVSKTK